MEDYNYDYDDYGRQEPDSKKTIRGYRIIILIMAAIMVVGAIIFLKWGNNKEENFAIERMELNDQFSDLMGDYDDLQTTNDTLNIQMAEQRHRADSIVERLNSERRLSANTIRQYEKELGTLRTVMRGYVQTIDSLNTLNKTLITENVAMRKQVTNERQRAELAEETVNELEVKVERGSVILANGITLTSLNDRDREVTRVRRAARLRVEFTLAANELANPGERPVYVRIIEPEGYPLANSAGATFAFEDETRIYSAMREIDYQNQELKVAVFYEGSGFTEGNYMVEIYLDGRLCGNSEINLR
jgi:hypothetical protein